MKTIAQILIAALVVVLVTPATYAADEVDSATHLPALNASVHAQDHGLRVNLVNMDKEKVEMTVKNSKGKVVYKKSLAQASFSSQVFKSRKFKKSGEYTAEFKSAGRTITKKVTL